MNQTALFLKPHGDIYYPHSVFFFLPLNIFQWSSWTTQLMIMHIQSEVCWCRSGPVPKNHFLNFRLIYKLAVVKEVGAINFLIYIVAENITGVVKLVSENCTGYLSSISYRKS